jgi:pimeloyl-ACP methyl ester carboxylesterase
MKTLTSILLILFFASLTSCFKNNTANNMREIKRDDAVINYEISGSGDTTLLFVHGSYMNQGYWKEQVEYFSPDYKVITLDLPGHGKSGKDRQHWSVEGFADDVVEVIKELDLKNVILIGHSLGADINLLAATSYPAPIMGFIGIDNFKNAATPLPPQFQQKTDTILQNLKTDFANTNEQYVNMVLVTPQTPEEISKRVINDYRNAYQPMGIATMPQVFNMFQTEKELLPKLKLKLYLINVDYMPTNEEPLKQYAGNGYEVLHMEGTCHFPMIENPGELNRLLQQCIQKISK